MCFASGGSSATQVTRPPTASLDAPLTATEKEQRRSESAAWSSKPRAGLNPFISFPQSRLKAQARYNRRFGGEDS